MDRQITALSQRLGVSVELVVVVFGQELLWLNSAPHPDPTVCIRAKAGFRRPLIELDAVAQVYLGQLSISTLKDRFFLEGFYRTGFDSCRRIHMRSKADSLRDMRDLLDANLFEATVQHPEKYVSLAKSATVQGRHKPGQGRPGKL